MAAGAEHYRALGLTYWQRRDAGPGIDRAAPSIAPEPARPAVAPAPEVAPARETQPPPAPVVAAAREAQPSPAPPPRGAADSGAAAAPDETPRPAVDEARVARILAMDWDELEGYVRAQSRGDATQAVFGVGPRDADLLIVGEAPGADEDRLGEPFVGRAGRLLDTMLATIGRDRRRNTYIANICKFRPPNNRDPHADEIAEDWPYLRRQIQLLKPRLILAVGRIAAQRLLDSSQPIGRLRGSVHMLEAEPVPVIVTYHPAYLLRSPREKAKSWRDLKLVRSEMATPG